MYLAVERCCTVCMYKYECGIYMYENTYIYYMIRYMYLEVQRCFTVCVCKYVCGIYIYIYENVYYMIRYKYRAANGAVLCVCINMYAEKKYLKICIIR